MLLCLLSLVWSGVFYRLYTDIKPELAFCEGPNVRGTILIHSEVAETPEWRNLT